jgi:murein DD-endopeptidase MepM/ murein hydrolase activator NlpD
MGDTDLMDDYLKRSTYVMIAIVCISIAGLLLSGCGGGKDEKEDEDGTEIVAADSSGMSVEDTLSSGESLYTSLVTGGLEPSHVVRVLDVLGEEVNLRSCKPGDSYKADLGNDGSILSLCYRKGMTERFTVALDSVGYVVTKEEVPLVSFTRRVEGVLKTSLWESFLDQGEDPQIALNLADVFAWEIDFVTDPRVGDSYIIIFEELHCEGRKLEIGNVLGAIYVNDGEEHTAFGFPDEDGKFDYYDGEGNSVRRVFLKSPLNYRRISSYFSHRRFHPILKVYRPHYGVDYAAPTGTPIVSIGDGRVVSAGWNGGLGKYVEVRHNNVYSSCYGHLSRYGRGVRRGVRVKQGQVIGYVGATGLATGPHLDFRVKKFGSYVNPLTIEYPRGEPVPENLREKFFAARDLIIKGLRYREMAAASSSGTDS